MQILVSSFQADTVTRLSIADLALSVLSPSILNMWIDDDTELLLKIEIVLLSHDAGIVLFIWALYKKTVKLCCWTAIWDNVYWHKKPVQYKRVFKIKWFLPYVVSVLWIEINTIWKYWSLFRNKKLVLRSKKPRIQKSWGRSIDFHINCTCWVLIKYLNCLICCCRLWVISLWPCADNAFLNEAVSGR